MVVAQGLKISGFGITHVGKVRQRNEDAIYIDPEGRFALLADGMGGHRGGQEASRLTLAAVRQALEAQYAQLALQSSDAIQGFLRTIFQDVSRQVHEAGCRDPRLAHMGTTLVCWLRLGAHVHVAHVGDSRCYMLRNEDLFQITMDHTFVNEQINLGVVRSQITDMGLRHAIFRNIGISPPSDPVHLAAPLEPGDIWLLCSDGLSGKVSHDEIAVELLERRSLDDGCRKLVEKAYAAGGEDNISVILMQVREG